MSFVFNIAKGRPLDLDFADQSWAPVEGTTGTTGTVILFLHTSGPQYARGTPWPRTPIKWRVKRVKRECSYSSYARRVVGPRW